MSYLEEALKVPGGSPGVPSYSRHPIFGMHGISLSTLLDHLRKEAEVITIGTETGVLENKRTSSSSFKEKGASSPQGEVNLKAATIEESDADYRKFYVHSEKLSIRLRAESEDDKHAWLDALRKAKGSTGDGLLQASSMSQKTLQLASQDRLGFRNAQLLETCMNADIRGRWKGHISRRSLFHERTNTARLPSKLGSGDAQFQEMLAGVRRQLAAKGANQDVQAYVEDLLLERHQSQAQALSAEVQKRRALVEHCNRLENAKRQLETDLVVEQRIRNRGSDRDSPSSTDDEQDEDDTRISNEDGSEDVFFDCNTDLSRMSSTPLLGNAQDDQGPSANGGWSQRPSSGGYAAAPAMAASDRSFGSASSSAAPYQAQVPQQAPAPVASSSAELAAKRYAGPEGTGMQQQAQHAQQGQQAQHSQGAAHHSSQSGGGDGDKSWIREMQPPPHRRDRLPKPQQHEKSVSLWSILKECIGKDLSRICLPVYFNEPLSVLQKTVEDLEYAELLNKAATFPAHSIERMMQITAFAVSSYSGTNNRMMKPFNPLLGETFEFQYPEQNWRGIAEKVVHHPTVIAAHGEGASWTFAGDCEVRSKFWGRSIELIPVGLIRLKFDDGDEYTWQKVTSAVNNLIMGKMYIDHTGIMRINNTGSGMVAKIKFKEASRLSSKDAHQVSATFEKNGQALPHTVSGKWDHSLDAHLPDGTTQRIWSPHPPPSDPTRYNLTRFAMMLNELTPPEMAKQIAPTDCRLRPDQHALEQGLYDEANAEKQRLEIKQRKARKEAEMGVPLEPRWFEKVPNAVPGETPAFVYKGGYWESRREGRWEGCRDIFSTDE